MLQDALLLLLQLLMSARSSAAARCHVCASCRRSASVRLQHRAKRLCVLLGCRAARGPPAPPVPAHANDSGEVGVAQLVSPRFDTALRHGHGRRAPPRRQVALQERVLLHLPLVLLRLRRRLLPPAALLLLLALLALLVVHLS